MRMPSCGHAVLAWNHRNCSRDQRVAGAPIPPSWQVLLSTVVVPLRIAFENAWSPSAISTLAALDYMADAIFVIDLLTNFTTGYLLDGPSISPAHQLDELNSMSLACTICLNDWPGSIGLARLA